MRHRIGTVAALVGFALALAALSPRRAEAQAALLDGLGGTAGYGEGVLAPGDDNASAAIDLTPAFPRGLRFYGSTSRTTAYVSTNGLVTFTGPNTSHTPATFPQSTPIIAPFWSDIDTRNRALGATRNSVYYDLSPGRFVATWYDVATYNQTSTPQNAFQLILTDATSVAIVGAFDVEFRYARCGWYRADKRTGSYNEARAGYDAGDNSHHATIAGSGTATMQLVCTSSNVGIDGVYRWQIRPPGSPTCGNAAREMGEACDDGNVVSNDGCSSVCQIDVALGTPCSSDAECTGTGFCTDGVCCSARCAGQCEACAEPGNVGSCIAVTGAPRVGRAACGGTAPCGGSCNGSSRTACGYANASTTCDDGAWCTTGEHCDGAGNCGGATPRSCADTLACTNDSCDEPGNTCRNVLSNGCAIDGACRVDGAIQPGNPCGECDPSRSTTAWSPRANGASCSDGLGCTTGDACDGAGHCEGTPMVCADDGLACTVELCVEPGTCTRTTPPGCVIGGTCFPPGASDPSNPCRECNPSRSTTAFTDAPFGRACNDSLGCTTGDFCNGAGACSGSPRSCPDDELACTSATCTEPGVCGQRVASGCLVGGRCVGSGAIDPSDPCAECDPSRTSDAYSLRSVGVTCGDPECVTGTVTPAPSCDATGDCVDGSPYACDGALCDATGATCLEGCTTDAQCAADYHCEAGTCVVDRDAGEPCDRDAKCVTGACADGVCCDGRCDGVCESCALAGATGTCTANAWGDDVDDECTGTRFCDGARGCVTPPVDAGMPDAGSGTDAGGSDAGGANDAGSGADAGMRVDAGATPSDAGTSLDASVPDDDAGIPPMFEDGGEGLVARGGGCSAAGSERSTWAPWALLALAFVLRRRRG